MHRIGAGGIEMRVVDHIVAGLDDGREEQIFSDSSLMNGNEILESENVAQGFFKMLIIAALSVCFITEHHAGPLVVAHGAGAGVGQQIDKDILRFQVEDVEVSFANALFAFFAGNEINRLYDLDSVWLGKVIHRTLQYVARCRRCQTQPTANSISNIGTTRTNPTNFPKK